MACCRAGTISMSSTRAARKAQSAISAPHPIRTSSRQADVRSRTCQDSPGPATTSPVDVVPGNSSISSCTSANRYKYRRRRSRPGGRAPEGFERQTVDLRDLSAAPLALRLESQYPGRSARSSRSRYIEDDREVANDYWDCAGRQTRPGVRPGMRGLPAYLDHRHPASVARKPKEGLRSTGGWTSRLAEFAVLDNRRYRDDDILRRRRVPAVRRRARGRGPRCSEAGRKPRGRARLRIRFLGTVEHRHAAAARRRPARTCHKQPNWFWNDAWDGYPLARQRLLRSLPVSTNVRNPVFLTSNWRSTSVVNDPPGKVTRPSTRTWRTGCVTRELPRAGGGRTAYRLPPCADDSVRSIRYGEPPQGTSALMTPERMRLDTFHDERRDLDG